MDSVGVVVAAGVAGVALGVYSLFKIAQILTGDCDVSLRSKSIPKDWYQGKVVWVTGASSGIGRALALELNSLGAKVILSSRRKVKLEEVQSQMTGANGPGQVYILPFDAEKTDKLPEVAKAATRAFGRVDVLVNNAGVSTWALCKETSLDVDFKVNRVDYLCPVVLAKSLLPDMCARRSGTIVNVSSFLGKSGVEFRSAYCGAKAGLLNFMNAVRVEVELDGLSITTVCPGPVATDVDSNSLDGSGKLAERQDPMIRGGVTAERCAHLILVAASNCVDEAWIAKNPYLVLMYMCQYMPNIYGFMLKRTSKQKQEEYLKGI